MKFTQILSVLFFALVTTTLSAQNADYSAKHISKRSCGTPRNMEIQKANNPELAQQLEQEEMDLSAYIAANQNSASKELIVIPVVVHVIYKLAYQNISDAQIQSQITVLNNDYRRLNADSFKTPAPWKSIAADCQIQFCLAKQDPNGIVTSGITRTQSTKSSFDINTDECKYTAQGGHDIWNRNKYLNIWVVPDITDNGQGGILGYAQMPGSSALTDGVVIGVQYFGTMGTAVAPFNKGRTATHEVGHFFSLFHIWGDDGNACWGSDNIDDTPNQADENYDSPTFPLNDACNTTANGVMFMNYMDYTDDAAMNLFTVGQRTRMLGSINTNASRSQLKTSIGCVSVGIETPNKEANLTIFPNPAQNTLNLNFESQLLVENLKLEICNALGETVFIQHFGNQNFINQSIDVQKFNEGIYFVRIFYNDAVQSKSFIKLK